MRRRAKRPLHTVIMERHHMDVVVQDVRSYLSREGVKWYKEKGMPL